MIEFTDTMPTDTGCAPCEPAVAVYEPPAPVAEPAPIAPPPPAPPELSFAAPPPLDLAPAPASPVAVEPVPAATPVAPAAEPAPLVIMPDTMASTGAPAPGSLVITPEQPTTPTLTIMPDLGGGASYQPIFPTTSWYELDAMVGSVGSGTAASSSAAGALIPHELTGEGLWPTSDQDRDGIPNASDGAPFTPAPRR